MSHISRVEKPHTTSDYQVGCANSDNIPGTQVTFNPWEGREGGRVWQNANTKQMEKRRQNQVIREMR